MQGHLKPRFVATLPITISGVDRNGFRFKQTAHTRDVSKQGARLSGIPLVLEVASPIEIEYRRRKALFRIVWVGHGIVPEAGVVCIDGSTCLWGEPLPGRRKIPAA